MTVVLSRPHAEGVLAALAATNRPVGDGVAGTFSGDVLTRFDSFPYSILYDLDGGGFDGPLSDPDADVAWPFQVTVVGVTPTQVRWLSDRVRAALDSVTVAGRSVMRLEPVGAAGIRREDDTANPPLFYSTPEWRLYTTPA